MALRSSGTCCAVRGCTNNQAKLNMWLQQQCFDHAPLTKRECPCEQRYSFHRLPTDEDSKQVWLRNINLKKPPKTFYVCSFHFVDKKPTDENPHPTLWLGSDSPPEKRRRLLGRVDDSVTTSSGESVMTSPQKMNHPGSPVRTNESAAAVLPSSPSSSRLAEGSSSLSVDHQSTNKPLWAPLETDAPITLDTSAEVHVCQLCGCWYETRKGLSSHARAHLRQLGIPDSDIKGSPIDFLYQIMEDEDLKPVSSEEQKPITSDSPPKSSSKHPSDLTSPHGSPPSKQLKSSEECICILCGKECENSKGLASHYSSHLRQIGITDMTGKTSVFQAVQELVNSGILEAAFSPKTNTASSSSAVLSTPPNRPLAPPLSPQRGQSQSPVRSPQSSPSPLNRAPKAKKGFRLAVDPLHRKPKPEPVEMDVSFQAEASNSNSNSPQKSPSAPAASKPFSAVSSTNLQSPPTVLCDFCGQLFDTRKALSCHVRAHLRQLGLSWSIKTSPIDLLRQVMLHSEEGKKGSSAAGKATWSLPGSSRPLDSPQAMETASDSSTTPLDYSMKEKSLSGKSGSSHPDASCELCGFHFENRKALASHARAHLRQLGIIEWKADGASSPIELLSELIRRDPVKVAAITERYRMGELFIKKSQRSAASPSLSTDSDSVPGSSLKADHRVGREDALIIAGTSTQSHSHTRTLVAHSNPYVRSPRGVHLPKHTLPTRGESHGTGSQHPPRSGSIPALLPRPPLTPLVKLVGKVYSLKCRFCEEVFHGPLSVQEQWITHLQKHILTLGYKGKASPPAAPVAAPALVHPVAV